VCLPSSFLLKIVYDFMPFMNPMHDFHITPRVVCDKYIFFTAIEVSPGGNGR
jgi:hypothetical protein